MLKLYLHIGMPKTGTTYIQNFLRLNNEVLKSEGYVYPDFGVRFDAIGVNRNGHFLVSTIKDENGKRLKEKELEIENECFDKLFNLFEAFPNVILSEESIWNSGERKRGKKFWNNLKSKLDSRGIELKVIVYLRRQDLFIQSFWAQQVKESDVSYTLKEFINSSRFKHIKLDYYKRLNQISNVVGKENILVRVYEKDQYIGPQKTIVSDFLTTVGLEYNDSYQELERLPNRSLSGIYLETKRQLNKIEGLNKRRNYIQNLLKKVADENDDVHSITSNEFMSGEDTYAFLKQYAESNEMVAREYLSREGGELFLDKLEVSDDKKTEYTAYDYVGVLAQMLELQHIRAGELSETISGLKSEIKELKIQNSKLQSTVDWVTTSFPKKVTRKLKRIFKPKKKA